jgi:hypothetical protein
VLISCEDYDLNNYRETVFISLDDIIYYYIKYFNKESTLEQLAENLLNYYINEDKGIYFIPSSIIQCLYMNYSGNKKIIRKEDIKDVAKEISIEALNSEKLYTYIKEICNGKVYFENKEDIYAAGDKAEQILKFAEVDFTHVDVIGIIPKEVVCSKHNMVNICNRNEKAANVNGIFFNEMVYDFPRYKRYYENIEEVKNELE